MRILSFQQNWIDYVTNVPKLSEDEFSSYRFPRKDKPWTCGEKVQCVFRTRSKDRLPLGIAQIRVLERPSTITDYDAMRDGFPNREEMMIWLQKGKGKLGVTLPMPHKLVVTWVEKFPGWYKMFGVKP